MAGNRKQWIRTLLTRSSREQASAEDFNRAEGRLEVTIAALLGIAAVATAFAAYKAELANGDSIKAFNEGIRTTDAASQQYVEGNQTYAQDAQIFLEYAKAAQEDNTDLVEYLQNDLMSPQLKEAVEWLGSEESGDAVTFDAEGSPYAIEAYATAEELDAETDALFDKAKDEDETGDRYTLVTVILAIALFLFGVGGVATRMPIKLGTVAAGAVILVVSLVLLITV